MKKVVALAACLFCFSFSTHAQVLISLLLGDKLNSDKLEFGLIGGLQSSNLSGEENGKLSHTLHIGFYFDFIMNDRWSFNPAVLVKSTTGVRYTNSISNVSGIDDLDSVLVGADVKRRIGYFQVPLLMKYNITPQFHAMLGPQVGIRTKAINEYTEGVAGGDLLFEENIQNDYKRLDAGFTAGFGFKLKPKDGMNLGVRYYYGVVDVLKDNPGDRQHNRDLYFYLTIPVGKAKAADVGAPN
ncbi:PorT family protein [Reichenbachiella carrageenanivorans]|uniref:PorT family protein n=1 Tax=Reichenbachiella carrageenanivorans TaxID=2979869 RepID=A0ABY6CYW5_9BACT|nr:porin family protein [Reichenbachiella carrageenanivorans]UXX79106.1 PorT family protein [Reichenbachiella carrageenanivorans]